LKKISVYTNNEYAQIAHLPLQRDWMDLTFNRHAYQCFPVSLSNRLGWGISYPEDISFIWDGINDSTADHVKVLSGEKYVHTGRGNRTISFNTNLTFFSEDDETLSLLTMPVPNYFIRGAQCMTTILSPSALQGEHPIAWMILEPHIEITIPANTPIASIIPISTTGIQNYELFVKKGKPEYMDDAWNIKMKKRGEVSQELNMAGKWTHFYRDAVDHNGDPLGQHESKKIVMKVHHENK
jgi:hypothetical protein